MEDVFSLILNLIEVNLRSFFLLLSFNSVLPACVHICREINKNGIPQKKKAREFIIWNVSETQNRTRVFTTLLFWANAHGY